MKKYFIQTVKGLLTLTFFCFLPGSLLAQKENNIWHFGDGFGLDFNAGTPTLIPSNMSTMEGCASVSDGAGNLLFYSNGQKIWDKNGNALMNSNGLLGNGADMIGAPNLTGSATQGVMIVRSISAPSQYYHFVLDASEDIAAGSPGYLRYSVIDMSLNNGAGAVVQGQKNIVIDSNLSEKMIVIPGNNCDLWLLVHDHTDGIYHAFRIDANGVNTTPIISNSGAPFNANLLGNTQMYICGEMRASPNGNKIVLATLANHLEIADFNKITGVVSNTDKLDTLYGYGVEFSPDGSKLYVAAVFEGLKQYDLSLLPNITAVRNSAVNLTPQDRIWGLRTGPDGKIYGFNRANTPGIFVSCINSPNATGTACNLDPYLIPLNANGFFPGNGFGSPAVTSVNASTIIHKQDTSICSKASMLLSGPEGYDKYLWANGTTNQTLEINTNSKVWCVSEKNCAVRIDTFNIDIKNITVDIGKDTSLCAGDSITLSANTTNAQYLWNDLSTASTLTINKPGTYSIAVKKEECITNDTIRIVNKTIDFSLGGDKILCEKETLNLSPGIAGNYTWQDGSSEKEKKVAAPGRYWLQVTEGSCSASDTVTIGYEICDCITMFPTAFTPNGDGKNDAISVKMNCESKNVRLMIFNRFGEMVFSSINNNEKWDGKYRGELADVGTYFYSLTFIGPRGKSYFQKGDITLIR